MGFDFPASPSVGQVYPATQTAGLPQWTFDGTAWVMKANVSIPTIYVSDTAPSSPVDNSMWWRSDVGLLYVRFRDVDGVQWVIATPQPVAGPQGPPGVWTQLTQAQYNALSPPDPYTLYVIVG